MSFTIGSLFDGSGGFPLAATMCGGTPVWASEIEPYPIAVTKTRFPYMKHLGSVTDIKGNKVEPVDVITFGSPCQDLSVAGKRAGLKHTDNGDEETTRSGLFMEAVRIIREMREATNGKYPRFAVWENVPGAFSSNRGEDFRIVLEELIKIAEPAAVMPPVPAKSGWPYSDSYTGDGWSLAYRVFDAQYWGVPQRRRRIYLVADFRGLCARKILFEREGLRGDFEESGAPWQGTPRDAEGGSRTADSTGECVTFEPGIAAREGGHIYKGVSGTLRANAGDNQMAVAYADMVLDDQGGQQISVRNDGKCPTLRAEMHGNVPAVIEAVVYNGENITSPLNKTNPQPMDPCHTLGTDSRNYLVYCLQGNMIGRTDKNDPQGDGVNVNTSFTLNATDKHSVAFQTYQKVTGPLMANSHPGSYTGQDAYNDMLLAEKEETPMQTRYIVRRLTPTECARLQGFTDRWGDIKKKTVLDFIMGTEEYEFWLNVRNTHAAINGKTVKDYTEQQMAIWYNKLPTDSAEYKLWGNGIALPCALYVMQGIAEVFL